MPERAEWGYTVQARQKFGERYLGRPLIARDTPVIGGVLYGTYGGEALVVDPAADPHAWDPLYADALRRATGPDGRVKRDRVMDAVFDVVSERMKYSQKGVERILKEIGGARGQFVEGTKVELGWFIAEGVGVCRHQALACCALLEMFKRDGHIRGDVSLDRNENWSPKGEARGHAWARYTSKAGTVFILDVAQRFIGELEEAGASAWNYRRPSDPSGLERTAGRYAFRAEQQRDAPKGRIRAYLSARREAAHSAPGAGLG